MGSSSKICPLQQVAPQRGQFGDGRAPRQELFEETFVDQAVEPDAVRRQHVICNTDRRRPD
jgi:hypothetical protein